MKTMIYAIKKNCEKEIERVELGNAIVCDNKISARKFDELKRKSFNLLSACNGEHIVIGTEDAIADFGGYPATGVINFVSFK